MKMNFIRFILKIEWIWFEIDDEMELFHFTASEGVNITCECDPYSVFTEFFDEQIVDHIVTESNMYAHQRISLNNPMKLSSGNPKWRDTERKEIYFLLCLMIL